MSADGDDWVGLRGLLPHLAGDAVEQAPLVFHAIGLAEWLFATRHCPRCGGRLEVRMAGHELECVECHRRQFPRTDPAVIMAITRGEPGSPDEALLLGRQDVWPAGRYSTLAGFLEPGETLEDAVRREVAEETGVVVGEVTYFGNQPWPLPASLMLGFLGRAIVRRDRRRRPRDPGRAVVHPRGRCRTEAEAGHAGAPRRRLDLAVTGRALVRRSAARLVVSRTGTAGSRPSASAASFSLTCASDGFVWAEPSAYTRVGTVWLPLLTRSTISRGLGLLLDVDDLEADALAVHLALQAVAVATPRGACTS